MVQRLSIISVVPEEYLTEIHQIKKTLCSYAHSHASLQFPPHITLAHIKIQDGELEQTLEKIGNISKNLEGCRVHLQGISCGTYQEKGKTKYHVKFNVEPNSQLIEVHKSLKELNELDKSNLGGSNYHITLVFGDLTEENYIGLREYLSRHKEFDKKFTYTCNDLSVLIREGNLWRIIKSFEV